MTSPDADTTTTTGDAPANENSTTEPDRGKDPAAEAEKWKALARKHESEAKANRGAAARLAELEESQKTAAQKLEERATAAEQRAAEVESRLVRAEIATEKGLTAAQAKRLVGTTREELAADADELLKDLAPASYDGGARTTAPAGKDMNRIMREAFGRA